MKDALAAAERTERIGKHDYDEIVPALRTSLLHLQEQVAEAPFAVLVLVDGSDLSGCDGVFERLHHWLDARYVRSEGFGPRPPEEAEFPWMRRYWVATPPRGWIGVHMRAWTNELVRLGAFEGLEEGELERRIGHARAFEQALVADGTLLLKLWIHVPKKRLRKRLTDAAKDRDWRIQPGERAVFEHWGDALPLAERVLEATETEATPWIVVSGEDERTRDLTVARHLERALRERLAAPADPTPSKPARLARDPHTRLDDLDLSKSLDDDEYEDKLERWQARLSKAHRDAHARGVGTVLVFEGQDAAGKGGAIRRLTGAMDATRYRVFPISAPSERERAHHWLWRFWRHVPRDGRVSVFDRSWYGRVLVERVEGFASETAWRRAYAEIEDFESQLVEHGLVLVKFWLQIDMAEQERRFEARKETSFKRYKITPEDWRNRERWLDYEAAVDEMVARTSGVVPWRLVPANDKHYARVEVVKTVTKAIEDRVG